MNIQNYSIFLDDDRFPIDTAEFSKICRNYHEFVETIDMYGIPSFVSFDHDIGDVVLNGKKCAEYIVEKAMDEGVDLEEFRWYVHSQNPIGAQNINCYLNSAKRNLKEK